MSCLLQALCCVADCEDLPFPNDSADVIISRLSAHHWHDPRAALKHFTRILKPGGVFILSDTVCPADFAANTFCNTFELLRDKSHVCNHTTSEWCAMMDDAGFVDSTVQLNYHFVLNFPSWIVRSRTSRVRADAIISLFNEAPRAISERFGVSNKILNDNFTFKLYGAVFTARTPS